MRPEGLQKDPEGLLVFVVIWFFVVLQQHTTHEPNAVARQQGRGKLSQNPMTCKLAE